MLYRHWWFLVENMISSFVVQNTKIKVEEHNEEHNEGWNFEAHNKVWNLQTCWRRTRDLRQVHGAKCMAPSAWRQVHGAKCMVKLNIMTWGHVTSCEMKPSPAVFANGRAKNYTEIYLHKEMWTYLHLTCLCECMYTCVYSHIRIRTHVCACIPCVHTHHTYTCTLMYMQLLSTSNNTYAYTHTYILF
jgi:hypothetical protein